ncbi:MAG: glycosyltransferase [Bacteroidales bacterium]|jgi:glycosyltransferase involved in cell wall biosynthesis
MINREIRNKKILISIPFLTLGGAETQALLLGIFLKNYGAVVEFVAFYKKDGKLIPKLQDQKVPYYIFPYDISVVHKKGFAKFSLIIRFIRFLRKGKYDYIVPFTYYPNLLCNLSCRFTSAEKCYWNQRGMETISMSILEKIAKILKPAYIANSEASLAYIVKRHKLNDYKGSVIYNGLPLIVPKEDASIWKDKLALRANDFCVVYTANFFPEKDHETLLQAINILKSNEKQDRRLRLVLAGYAINAECLNKVKALVLDLHLEENVIFIESTDDVAGLLSVADLAVLTSVSEGLSNALLEYMYFRLPIVASNIPSNKEVLGQNYPYLYSLGNQIELAAKIEVLMNEPLERAKTGKLNYQRVTSVFNTEKMGNAYLKLLLS